MEPWKTNMVLVYMQHYLGTLHVPTISQIDRLIQQNVPDLDKQTHLRRTLLHWIHSFEGQRGGSRNTFFNYTIGQLVAHIHDLEETNPSNREDPMDDDHDDEISKEDADSDDHVGLVDDDSLDQL